jgi:hypothetical protein
MGILASVYIWAWVMFCWIPYAAAVERCAARGGL